MIQIERQQVRDAGLVVLLALVVTALIALALGGCGPSEVGAGADAARPEADAGPSPDAPASPDAAPSADAGSAADAGPVPDGGPGVCPAGPEGLGCLFALHDEVAAGCAPARLAHLRQSLLARRGTLPAWHQGRALFVTWDNGAAVAGDFNGWDANVQGTLQLCGSDLWIADVAVPSGRHAYKLVRDGLWFLDPENWAFAYDDFAGNPDGRNSVINTYDSGLGHLVQPAPELCSTALGNCRRFTTYLPRGYGDPASAAITYPVVFMHDGQNLFDDPDCCFGHTGWEINVTLDAEVAAGHVPETVIVGFDHAGAQRVDEYGRSTADGGLQETFMDFQVTQVQPTAAGYWRLDPDRYFTAGSSLGGVIAFRLALAHPDIYAGAASLSGAFWFGKDTSTAVADVLAATGKVDVALYLDHGGTAAGGEDNHADNVELRDLLVAAGWQRADSPGCTAGNDALCYFHDAGASHDELAWKARAWRFLRYLLD